MASHLLMEVKIRVNALNGMPDEDYERIIEQIQCIDFAAMLKQKVDEVSSTPIEVNVDC